MSHTGQPRDSDSPPISDDVTRTVAGGGEAVAGAMPVPEIEGYEILDELGRGGMGVVYRARQTDAGGRLVALKVMLGEQFATPEQLRRFEREVEIAAELSHSCIARIYDSGLTQGHHYFAMEFIDGQSLDAFCKDRNPKTTREKLEQRGQEKYQRMLKEWTAERAESESGLPGRDTQ